MGFRNFQKLKSHPFFGGFDFNLLKDDDFKPTECMAIYKADEKEMNNSAMAISPNN